MYVHTTNTPNTTKKNKTIRDFYLKTLCINLNVYNERFEYFSVKFTGGF